MVVFSSYEVAERSVSQGVLSWDSSFDSRLSYVAYVVVCFSKTSKVMRCQKCQKVPNRLLSLLAPRRLAYLEKPHILSWERRDQCPRAIPVLVCHDEVVVECDAEQAADAKAWLEKAMIGGMDAVMNSAGKACVPVEVEARIARSWGQGG